MRFPVLVDESGMPLLIHMYASPSTIITILQVLNANSPAAISSL